MRQRFRNKKERARRVEEAAERQAIRDRKTPEQQLTTLTARSLNGLGGSRRETRRLLAIIEDGEPIGGVRLA